MPPRAIFIVTCYNYGRVVAYKVDSLLDQTVEALEVIRRLGPLAPACLSLRSRLHL